MAKPDRPRAASRSRAFALSGLALVWLGCAAGSRYKVLSTLFDGVPPPKSAPAPATGAAEVVADGGSRRVGRVVHEPYAARQCDACHDSRATNRLVVPERELCFQCHEFEGAKRYVHGPLASGGCLLCHDPHDSPNRHLLLEASDGFCLSCHDRADLRPLSGHEAPRVDCTACHEAHMSDRKFLLR